MPKPLFQHTSLEFGGNVELELNPNLEMYLLFEKGMRGRVSYISKRYSTANNKYLKFDDPKQESNRIYLDENNLHGYAMPTMLLTNGFKWIDPKEFRLNKCTSNSSKDVFSKLILIILKNYKNYTMIILWLQVKQKSKKKCCLVIN